MDNEKRKQLIASRLEAMSGGFRAEFEALLADEISVGAVGVGTAEQVRASGHSTRVRILCRKRCL